MKIFISIVTTLIAACAKTLFTIITLPLRIIGL